MTHPSWSGLPKNMEDMKNKNFKHMHPNIVNISKNYFNHKIYHVILNITCNNNIR